MPAKSKAQQRLFGMVHAYQAGDLENPSKEVKRIAKEISKKDALKFAKTKQKGLPEFVDGEDKPKKKHIKERIHDIVKECVQNTLMEYAEYDGNDLDYGLVYDNASRLLHDDEYQPKYYAWQTIARDCGYRLDTLNEDDLELVKDAVEDAMADLEEEK